MEERDEKLPFNTVSLKVNSCNMKLPGVTLSKQNEAGHIDKKKARTSLPST